MHLLALDARAPRFGAELLQVMAEAVVPVAAVPRGGRRIVPVRGARRTRAGARALAGTRVRAGRGWQAEREAQRELLRARVLVVRRLLVVRLLQLQAHLEAAARAAFRRRRAGHWART